MHTLTHAHTNKQYVAICFVRIVVLDKACIMFVCLGGIISTFLDMHVNHITSTWWSMSPKADATDVLK